MRSQIYILSMNEALKELKFLAIEIQTVSRVAGWTSAIVWKGIYSMLHINSAAKPWKQNLKMPRVWDGTEIGMCTKELISHQILLITRSTHRPWRTAGQLITSQRKLSFTKSKVITITRPIKSSNIFFFQNQQSNN